jgi:hypothetical protein
MVELVGVLAVLSIEWSSSEGMRCELHVAEETVGWLGLVQETGRSAGGAQGHDAKSDIDGRR